MFGLLRTTILSLALAFGAGPVLADNWTQGKVAYADGDYASALNNWLPLVKKGNAAAQNNLGKMYSNGEGVLQDNIRAHMWYGIASANGHRRAGEWRDETAAKMTSADISKAQSMARECMNSNYKNCGW